jgi:hypothetical protein
VRAAGLRIVPFRAVRFGCGLANGDEISFQQPRIPPLIAFRVFDPTDGGTMIAMAAATPAADKTLILFRIAPSLKRTEISL